MRMMLFLAVMDTPREHSDDIEIFFDTFNKALGDYLNEPEYIWDPFLIMMDHKGTNFEALECIYGENFRKYKAVTCQWHFLHCTEKYLMKCLESERKSFCTWCMQLCQAHTCKEYCRLAGLIKGVTKKYGFLPWWKWWDPLCPHVVPAIRGFNLPQMNMAEVGQSKMKPEKRLWLTEAVKVDMVKYAFQTNKNNRFLKNSEKVGGHGLTMKKRREHKRAEEHWFVDQFCDLIENGNLLEEMEDPNDLAFMPSARAKHKAPAHDISNQEKPKKGKKVPKGGKKLPNCSSQGFNPHYTEETPRPTQTQSLKKKDAREIDNPDTHIMVPDDINCDFVKANHVYYVVLSPHLKKSDKLITSCRGCNGKITLEEKKFPHNMVFQYRYYRKVPQGPPEQRTWVMSQDWKNCYFHARDMGCLHQLQELQNVDIPQVYMDNANFKALKAENICVLK